MNLNELRDQIHANAVEKGFWDKPLSDSHCLMLVITELSEAVEADRKGKYFDFSNNDFDHYCRASDKDGFLKAFEDHIKNTVSDEIADAFIRLLDIAGARNLNLNRFCLQHVVTERKTFTENIYAIIKDIMNYKYSQEEQVNYALNQIRRLSEILNIDLSWHVKMKMKYNQSREKMHGKKY